MGIRTFFADTLVSLVNGLGMIGSDKSASTAYVAIQYTDQQLAEMVRASWLPRKIVTIPADDSFRKWRAWQAEDSDITLIEAEEKRLNIKGKLREAKLKARLFGGAALYIGTGTERPEEPLKPEQIGRGGIPYLNVLRRMDLKPEGIVKDIASEYYGMPEFFQLSNNLGAQTRIHASRLVIFKGDELPDEELSPVAYQGWGDSVLTSTLNAIKQADGTLANIASLVFEAKIDIIRIPDLMASLAHPEYKGRLLDRFQLASVAKGNNGTLILDKDEEYEQKTFNFATLPDVAQTFLQVVSGAADIPATRLLGQSPAGMNATGESDLRNYYDRISSNQTLEIDPAIYNLNECLIRSATGGRDEDTHYIWGSLWQISDKERADIGKIDAETINTLNNTGLFPQEALAKAGANMLVEHSIMPGLMEEIDEAGGLPDYELEAEQEQERQLAQITARTPVAANSNETRALVANDAAPRSLYISRKVLNADEIRAWAKGQGFETVQDDLHVTIIHTRTPLDWIKVGQASSWGEDEDGNMTINAGGPRLMERFGEAVVLQFAATRLAWRFSSIVHEFDAEVDYPEYQPHITITWKGGDAIELDKIEPYRGKIVLGPEIFEEVDDNWRANITEA
jgi:phage-related protein (TIGR01555 family)